MILTLCVVCLHWQNPYCGKLSITKELDNPMTGKLEGKVAIITGASAGIGEATAIALASVGATVVLAARRGDRLKALAERIEASGGKALPIITDVADETQVNNLVAKANAELGRVDILVNNAGIALLGTIEAGNSSDWRRSFDLNVLGLLYATHAVLPLLKAQKSGHIVNISSVAGRTARAGLGVYNATKWGVNALSEALRQEVHKDNIRVTIIEPGLVDTEIDDQITDPVAKQRIEERRKSIQPLQSEDIAAAIVYALTQPPHVNVNEILIRPTGQEH
ncbi:MAG: SDR family oxidoreductase [Nostoc sp.]|uniref:SDR family oxidoreductase n=1 Tax=Nostoc sp. TaxID=1180 RepID=UPI002FF7D895